MKYFLVILIMKAIQLLQEVKIILAKYGFFSDYFLLILKKINLCINFFRRDE